MFKFVSEMRKEIEKFTHRSGSSLGFAWRSVILVGLRQTLLKDLLLLLDNTEQPLCNNYDINKSDFLS